MNNCCKPPDNKDNFVDHPQRICPSNGSKGKPVSIITLKSLLKPEALEKLEPEQSYSFCRHSECPTVYFSNSGQTFITTDLKVPVFQKNSNREVPVCYCFNWTRQRIQREIEHQRESQVIASITTHIQAKRCGCEVNNPQGSCCLGNVKRVVEDFKILYS